MRTRYEVIVIGGGHAGVEAAWAAASALGGAGRVALVTMDPARIGQMSCNPAIGGLGKGQMVREIDALGGVMGRAIDATGILFHVLNTSKGAAVRGPRAQADKYAYAAEVQRLLSTRPSIDVIAGVVDELLVEDGCVRGVRLPEGAGRVEASAAVIDANARGDAQAAPVYSSCPPLDRRAAAAVVVTAPAVVLTTGTFMRGLMHTGPEQSAGGRAGEGAAVGISAMLQRLGFELGRLKTGTPPRIARASIDWEALPAQRGDERPVPFSDVTDGAFPALAQVECRVTRTAPEAHALIRANLHRAPMFSGQIEAQAGPRYCPSIEDKVVRFAQRDSHHVFLEPESRHTSEIYANGISTSLPRDVQDVLVRSMPGCAGAEILRYGYAVEYDMVWPHQIDSTCMTKRVHGLFLAGQINCTTGYEEAAGQGVVAGLNAARLAGGLDPVRLGRDEALVGVMLDDLVTKTPREPYRMFTSRAEHRLHLRADNADARLTPRAREWGLVDDARWRAYEQRRDALDAIRAQVATTRVAGRELAAAARRPDMALDAFAAQLDGHHRRHLVERVLTELRYAGYIARQQAEVRRQAQADRQEIPRGLDLAGVRGLRAEASEVLARFRPATMGQAARLAGVNPADLTILAVAIKRHRARSGR